MKNYDGYNEDKRMTNKEITNKKLTSTYGQRL